MSKETDNEQSRRGKRKRNRQELQHELSRELQQEEDRRAMEEIKYQHRNKYEDAAIIFVTTLLLCYIILFVLNLAFNFLFGQAVVMLGVSLSFIYPFFHAAAWIIAIISAYRRRSLLDDWF